METCRTTAIVICPPGPPAETVERCVAGLTVGERLLLALAHEGFDRALCLGPGARPASARAAIRVEELETARLAPGERAVLLPADLVFDRRLLATVDAAPAVAPLRPSGAGGGFAVRVVDRATAREAERALLAALRKPTDGVVSRLLNRRISLALTRLLVRTGVRPDALTIALMGLGILCGVAAGIGAPWWVLVIAGLLFQGHSILDGCDGELARLTYRFSRRGQWLDSMGDALANYLFCLGLAVGQARAHGWIWLYAAAALLLAVQCHATGLGARRGARMGTGDLVAVPNVVTGGPPRGAWWRFMRGFHLAARRDTFALLTALLTAMQLPLAAFGVFAVGSVAIACGMTVNEWRLRALEREGMPLPRWSCSPATAQSRR
jgi:phosphatidylglycerophosphate synthase